MSSRGPSREWVVAASALVLYLGLAAVQSYPTTADPFHSTVGGGGGDAALFLWFLSHTAHALFHTGGHGLLVTHDLNFPAGVNAMWNTGLLLPAVVLSPVTELAGPGLTLLIISFVGPPLSAWSAFLCSRRFLSTLPARLVVGLVFGFSPAIMAAQLGHFQLTLLMLVPPILLLTVDGATGRRAPRRTGLLLGLAVGCQVLIGEEVLALTAVAIVVVLVVLAVQRWRLVRARFWPALLAAAWAIPSAVLVAGYPLFVQFFGPLRVHGDVQAADTYDLDPAQVLVPSALVHWRSAYLLRVLHPWALNDSERMGYLGLPLLLLLAVILVRRRADLVARTAGLSALLLGVLAIGFTLHLRGVATGIAMPWQLTRGLPVIGGILPVRWMLLVALLAGLLVGLAVDALPRDRRGVLGAVVIAACLLPLWPSRSAPAMPTGTPAYFTQGPPKGTVLVVPFPVPLRSKAMTWAAEAGTAFALPGGYFLGPDPHGLAVFGTRPRRPTAVLLDHVASGAAVPPVTDAARTDLVADLRFWKSTTVVLGPAEHEQELLELLTELIGRPPEQTRGVYVWNEVAQP